MRPDTRLKSCLAFFLIGLAVSCLYAPFYGYKHVFRGYHPLWSRPYDGSMDLGTLQVEWLLLIASSAVLFFLLEWTESIGKLVKSGARFLSSRKLLMPLLLVLIGGFVIWVTVEWFDSRSLELDRAISQQEASDAGRLSGVFVRRKEKEFELALKTKEEIRRKARAILYAPVNWRCTRLSPLNAYANLETKMVSADFMNYKFWYSGNPEDMEEALSHYKSVQLEMLDSQFNIAASWTIPSEAFAWKGQPGKKILCASGKIRSSESLYSLFASWRFY